MDTIATRSPATIAGTASGSSTRQSVCAALAHPARRLEHLRRRAAEPVEDVAEEDQQRVADERDLDRRHGQPGQGTSSWKSARLGIVYTTAERTRTAPRAGGSGARGAQRRARGRSRSRRRSASASRARGAPAGSPGPSCRAPSPCRRGGSRTTQSLASPKSGITGSVRHVEQLGQPVERHDAPRLLSRPDDERARACVIISESASRRVVLSARDRA